MDVKHEEILRPGLHKPTDEDRRIKREGEENNERK